MGLLLHQNNVKYYSVFNVPSITNTNRFGQILFFRSEGENCSLPKLASAAEISEHVPINNTSSKDTENLQSESLLKHSNLHPLLPILDTGKRPRINSNIKGIIKTKTESFAKDEDEGFDSPRKSLTRSHSEV